MNSCFLLELRLPDRTACCTVESQKDEEHSAFYSNLPLKMQAKEMDLRWC